VGIGHIGVMVESDSTLQFSYKSKQGRKHMTEQANVYTSTDTELSVVIDIFDRKKLGLAKYKVSVADNPLTLLQWMQHEYEEQLDAVIYKKRCIDELKKQIGAKP
jgi:hypothetical protein